MKLFGDVSLQNPGHVTVMEMKRPPYNYFDELLIGNLADALEYLDEVSDCRAVVLAAPRRSLICYTRNRRLPSLPCCEPSPGPC